MSQPSLLPACLLGGPTRSMIQHRELVAVVLLLCIHVGLIAYSATRHSPTFLEPAFLASGISHWKSGRFELYRVNPPLVRLVAAVPVLAVGCETDWDQFYEGPGSRAEFPIGAAWIKANGTQSIPLLLYARWACLPFTLIGGYVAYRWAKELYGTNAGLVTLFIWTFEPNLLAHAELITPDCACWSLGVLAGYAFWRWLKRPTWARAGLTGGALGLALASKMSWLILFGLWPVLWLTWRLLKPDARQESNLDRHETLIEHTDLRISSSRPQPPAMQLLLILLLGVYFLNLGYVFDGVGVRLQDFTFVSKMLTGREKPGQAGNRFRDSWLGYLPVPLPKQYVLGFDSQKKDLEDFHQPSYLCGEWRQGGWWHYYVYGLWVKVPCSLWLLFATIVVSRACQRTRPAPCRDEIILLAPAVAILVVVSAQTEFNIHLRYVYPSLALTTIFLGQNFGWSAKYRDFATVVRAMMLLYFVHCSLFAYPHHLAYFNDFAGGPHNGPRHLLGSSFDWGQDWLFVRAAMQSTAPGEESSVAWQPTMDTYNPEHLGVAVANSPEQLRNCTCIFVSYQALMRTQNHHGTDTDTTALKLPAAGEAPIVRAGMTHGGFQARKVSAN